METVSVHASPLATGYDIINVDEPHEPHEPHDNSEAPSEVSDLRVRLPL